MKRQFVTTPNQNPEQIARDQIDKRLAEAGWIVQDKRAIDLSAGLGIAVREYQTDIGPATMSFSLALAAGLDVRVEFLGLEDEEFVEIHRPISSLDTPVARRQWLESISFFRYAENHHISNDIQAYADRLRVLSNGGQIYGLAALPTRSGVLVEPLAKFIDRVIFPPLEGASLSPSVKPEPA
jgi:hypothetical protein